LLLLEFSGFFGDLDFSKRGWNLRLTMVIMGEQDLTHAKNSSLQGDA
jgi:hypothetical protein